MGTSSYCADV